MALARLVPLLNTAIAAQVRMIFVEYGGFSRPRYARVAFSHCREWLSRPVGVLWPLWLALWAVVVAVGEWQRD